MEKGRRERRGKEEREERTAEERKREEREREREERREGISEHKNVPLRARFGCLRCCGGEGGCSREGGVPINKKHAYMGVFLVFSGGKVNEHVRHAHTGMPYVFAGCGGGVREKGRAIHEKSKRTHKARLYGRALCALQAVGGGGGPGQEKMRPSGHVSHVFCVLGRRGGGRDAAS